MTDLERRFESAMRDIYFRAKRECRYNAERFYQMIDQRGAIETAKSLISKPEGSDGFTNLYMMGRLDLTVEALVLKDEYMELFSEDEHQLCREKLLKANYQV